MNGEITGPIAPIPGQESVPYQPRHAAEEIDVRLLEGQARAADEYRYSQMFRQFLAEYALQRGPFDPDATPTRRERFAREQRRIAAEAAEQQVIARGYADDKRSRIQKTRSSPIPYEGRHRKPAEYSGEAVNTPGGTKYIGRAPASPPRTEATQETQQPATPEPPESEPAPEEPDEPLTGQERRKGRLRGAWYAAGAAMSAYFLHPEKGRRRQVVAVLAGYAAVGAAAYLAGKRPFGLDFDFRDGVHVSPPSALPPSPPQTQPFSEHFYDNLQPQDYRGQAYEWGAVADSAGPAHATAQLLDMVQDARGQGAEVGTWGNADTGHWGISYIEVPLAGGGSKAYYDTQHKLAILQYLSEMSEYNPNANSE